MIRRLRGRCEDLLRWSKEDAAFNCLESRNKLQKFMNWRLQTFKWPQKLLEDDLHINWKVICQIVHDYLEERKICMKLYHTASQMSKGSQNHDLWRLHLGQSDQSTFSQFYWCWRWAFGVSVKFWNKIWGTHWRTESPALESLACKCWGSK